MSKIIQIERYIETLHCFHWATIDHFGLWFPGHLRRSRTVLQRLEKRGKVKTTYLGKKKVYALPRKNRGGAGEFSKVEHGLACTECLVRFFRSNTTGEIIPERFFYGLGAVPEWGIRYPNGRMILLEYCTKSNWYYSGNIRGKLGAYRKNLLKIEDKFQAKAIVIFVADVTHAAVKREVGSAGGVPPVYEGTDSPSPFFFCDYETFKSIPIGEALKAPIYFWMDGKEYPLA